MRSTVLLLISLLPTTAVAEQPTMEMGAHGAWLGQDFTRSFAGGAQLGLRFSRTASLELTGTAYVDLGAQDWRSFTHHMITDRQLSPDTTKPRSRGALLLRLSPLQGVLAAPTSRFDLQLFSGMGVVATRDDAAVVQCRSPCPSTDGGGVHPTMELGLGASLDVSHRTVVRVDVGRMFWVEKLNDGDLDLHAPTMVQVGATVRLTKDQPAPPGVEPDPDRP